MANKIDWEKHNARRKHSESDDEFARARSAPTPSSLAIRVSPSMLGRISSGMRAKKISAEGLAKAIGREPADVVKLVSGETSLIRAGSLRGLYRALDFDDPEWWVAVDRQCLIKERKRKKERKK